jgi:serine/threonine-protein kinase
MSPEQCRGSTDVDHRTDIYSLGCMLFEMVTGRPPFVREGAGDLIIAHATEPAPAGSSLVPELPVEADHLLSRMLAKRPGDRPQTMVEVANALARLGGAPNIPAATLALPPPSSPQARTSVLPPLRGSGDRRAESTTFGRTTGEVATAQDVARSRIPRLAAISVGVVAAVGIAGFLVMSGRAPPPTTAPTSTSAVPAALIEGAPPTERTQPAENAPEKAAAKQPVPAAKESTQNETAPLPLDGKPQAAKTERPSSKKNRKNSARTRARERSPDDEKAPLLDL